MLPNQRGCVGQVSRTFPGSASSAETPAIHRQAPHTPGPFDGRTPAAPHRAGCGRSAPQGLSETTRTAQRSNQEFIPSKIVKFSARAGPIPGPGCNTGILGFRGFFSQGCQGISVCRVFAGSCYTQLPRSSFNPITPGPV